MTFKLWHQLTGNYRAVVRFKKGTNRGCVGMSIGTDTVTMSPVGDQGIDLYGSGTEFADVDLGLVTFSASGDRFLKFTATGKNQSSSGYRMVIDSIELIPQ